MSEMQKKPSVVEIAKLGFKANGWDFYEMEKDFNQLGKSYDYCIVKYNTRTKKTHSICISDKRSLINFCYKQGYTSFNPCAISRAYFKFQKNTFSRDSYNGDKRRSISILKHIKKEDQNG